MFYSFLILRIFTLLAFLLSCNENFESSKNHKLYNGLHEENYLGENRENAYEFLNAHLFLLSKLRNPKDILIKTGISKEEILFLSKKIEDFYNYKMVLAKDGQHYSVVEYLGRNNGGSGWLEVLTKENVCIGSKTVVEDGKVISNIKSALGIKINSRQEPIYENRSKQRRIPFPKEIYLEKKQYEEIKQAIETVKQSILFASSLYLQLDKFKYNIDRFYLKDSTGDYFKENEAKNQADKTIAQIDQNLEILSRKLAQEGPKELNKLNENGLIDETLNLLQSLSSAIDNATDFISSITQRRNGVLIFQSGNGIDEKKQRKINEKLKIYISKFIPSFERLKKVVETSAIDLENQASTSSEAPPAYF